MLKIRCPEAKYVTRYNLSGYKLIFSNHDPVRIFGHANIKKRKAQKFLGLFGKLTKRMKQF